ncbi:TIGR02147 family protein, partial [bacterium]|nr:TIGR02147 family protein [bacterium]MBU1917143.1 TIGR02147 family protein [bacterium]
MLNQENIKHIEITDYNDYVAFIRDLVEYKKETSAFSFRIFCQKSGFRSPSYLKWVIEGTRPISLRSVHKFIQGLGLTKREAKYFLIMVNYKEAKD